MLADIFMPIMATVVTPLLFVFLIVVGSDVKEGRL
jgi:uncharacterized membrane protein